MELHSVFCIPCCHAERWCWKPTGDEPPDLLEQGLELTHTSRGVLVHLTCRVHHSYLPLPFISILCLELVKINPIPCLFRCPDSITYLVSSKLVIL